MLLATYSVQELSEGLLVSGHPGGLGGLFGNGGWIAFPLALMFGLLAWLAARGLEAVEDHFVRRRVCRAPRRAPLRIGALREPPGRWPQLDRLASGFASRPPPLGT